MDKKFKKSTVTVLSLGLAFSFPFTPVFAQSASLTKSSLNNLKFKHVAKEQVNINGYTHTLDFKGPLEEMKKLMQRAQSQYNKVKQVQAKLDQLRPQIRNLQEVVKRWSRTQTSWSMQAIATFQRSNQLEAAKKQNELRWLQSLQKGHEAERQKELAALAGLLPDLFDKIKQQQRILETWDSPRAILPPEQMDELDKILKQVEQLQQEQKKLTAKKRPKRELQNYDLNEGLEKQKTLRKVKETQQQELKTDLQKQEARLTTLQGLEQKITQAEEQVKTINQDAKSAPAPRSKRSARSAPPQTTSLVQGKYVKLQDVLEKKKKVQEEESKLNKKVETVLRQVEEKQKEIDEKKKKMEEEKKKLEDQVEQHEMEKLAKKFVKEGHQVDRAISKEQWNKVLELVQKMNEESQKQQKK